MAFQVTMFFQMSVWGWSESHFNAAAGVIDALERTDALEDARRQCLPSAAIHLGSRVSDIAIRGDSLLTPSKGNGTATWSDTVDWGWTAILGKETTNTLSVRGQIHLRPGPETPGGAGAPLRGDVPAAVLATLQAFGNELTLAPKQWAVRGIDPGLPTLNIKGISFVGALATVTTFGNHGVEAGEMFRIGRVAPIPGRCINGLYRAESVPTLDSIAFTAAPGATEAVGSSGFLRGQRRLLFPIVTVFWPQIMVRKTGRPFGLPRGRRSNRVVCCPALAP